MFLVSVGLLPDNLFVLSTEESKMRERLSEKYRSMNGNTEPSEQLIKHSIDECQLNLKAVEEVFKGHYSDINTFNKKKSDIIEEIDVIYN
jgi:thiamine biosynthesis lipoprotein ApbE